MGLNEHAIRLSFLKYVYEAGDDRFEITNAGVRFILIPDWKPVVWREESKKKPVMEICLQIHFSMLIKRSLMINLISQQTIENASNLNFDVQSHLARLHSELIATGAINLKGLKSLVIRYTEDRIADGNLGYAIMDVNPLIQDCRRIEIHTDIA